MRAADAGTKLAESIIEMIHLMYQRQTALRFLEELVVRLQQELHRRRKEVLK